MFHLSSSISCELNWNIISLSRRRRSENFRYMYIYIYIYIYKRKNILYVPLEFEHMFRTQLEHILSVAPQARRKIYVHTYVND